MATVYFKNFLLELDQENSDYHLAKLAVVRICFSVLLMGSLLTNYQYSNWQIFSAENLVLFIALFAMTFALTCCALFGIRTRYTIGALGVFTIILNGVPFYLENIPYFMHAQIFFGLGFLIINSAPLDRFASLNRSNTENYASISASKTIKQFVCYLYGVYFFSAVSKIQTGFLSGHSLKINFSNATLGSLPAPISIPDSFYVFLSWGAVLFELAIPVFLTLKKTRSVALWACFAFHMLGLFLIHPTYYSFAMPLALIVLIDGERFVHWLGFERIILKSTSNSNLSTS